MMRLIWPRSVWQLLKKEWRAQRNNCVFLVAGAVLCGALLCLFVYTDVSLAGFSRGDVAEVLIKLLVLPIFVLLIPAMAGATASASDKSLDVDAWHAALPVSRWTALTVKYLVSTAVVVVSGGVMIAALSRVLPPEQQVLVGGWFVQGTPIWLALLAGGAGFFGGAVAQRDYQGLFLGLGVLLMVAGAMYLADPTVIVSPLLPEAFRVEGEDFIRRSMAVFILRFVATGMALYYGGMLISRYVPQRRGLARWMLALGLPLMVMFAMTLWNINKEYRQYMKQTPLALDVRTASGDVTSPFHYVEHRGYFESPFPGLLYDGTKQAVPVTIASNGRIRQFPQAIARHRNVHYAEDSTGEMREVLQDSNKYAGDYISPGGRLLFSSHYVYGPLGLTIPQVWLPGFVKDHIVAEWAPSQQKSEMTKPVYLPDRWVRRQLNVSDYTFEWSHPDDEALFNQHSDGTYLVLRRSAQSGTLYNPTALFPLGMADDQGVSLTAIMEFSYSHTREKFGHYAFKGWTHGHISGLTSDMKYGYEMTESGGVKFHAVKTEMPGRDLLTAEPDELVDYVILTTETKISITPMATLPVLDVNGHYAVVMPCRHDTYFPFPEYGVILFNPKSGQNLWLPCSDQFCGIMHRQIYAFAQDRFRELFEGGDTMATVSTQGKIVLQSERQVMIFDQTGTDPFYIGTWSISGLSVPKGRIQEYMGKYYVMYNRSFEDFVKYGKVLDQWSLY